MAEKSHKRRRYLIKNVFQLKYTLSILLIFLTVILMSGLGLYVGMWASIVENFSEFKVSQDLESAKRITDYEKARYQRGDHRLERIFKEAALLSEQQKETLENALKAVNRSLLPKIALLSVLIFIAGIFISHKIAGPMYRFERSAEAVKEGNLTAHFTIRKTDEMKETASVLEGMLEALRNDIERIKIAERKLHGILDAIAKNIPQEETKIFRQYLRQIEETVSRYKT